MRIIIEFEISKDAPAPLIILNEINDCLRKLIKENLIEDYSLSIDSENYEQIVLVAKIKEDSANNEA
jgi:hypothetical protein